MPGSGLAAPARPVKRKARPASRPALPPRTAALFWYPPGRERSGMKNLALRLEQEHHSATATDETAIAAAARACGQLAVECSDVSGYVAGVADRIGGNLQTLDALETVTRRLLRDQSRVAQSADEARRLTSQALDSLLRGAADIDGSIEDFSGLVELVVRLGRRMAS